ncbi:P80 family lipoprotein [Mycoplasma sp. ES3225-GEN-MYC]|uniref:P68 family surface lipoprotein n=1 Tax=Mycoplasma miroungigenitalium TaxID=754515 RepID=UPI001C122172|nr:P80 family lipoprotein [Mycoplasma miroungigenitalium]MBU4691904.1 P80 family lipoprotein [Mycoplasma miroungigenitalium]
MKKNKLLLSIGAIAGTASVAAPLLAASCSNDKFDKSREKLIFAVTFSRGKEQWNAVDGVIRKYNAEVVQPKRKELQAKIANAKGDEKAKLEAELATYMEVELKNIGSGYGAGHTEVVSNMKNNNIKQLPNMTINYASTIAEIVNYGRKVDVSDKSFGDLAIQRNVFEKSFVDVNDKITGVAEGGHYSLPIMKSTVVFGINGPIYKYVFKTLKNAGYTIDESLVNDFKVDTTDWDGDLVVIGDDEHFGKAIAKEEIEKIFTEAKYPSKKIGANVLTEFKTYIKFITDAIKIFEKSKSVDKSSVALLGIDDPSGILNTVLYSKLGGKDKDMPMSVIKGSDGSVKVSFTGIADKNSKSYKATREVYDLVMDAVEAGALKVYGGGAYSSADQTNHKVGANFGSTAGYTHNFIDAGDIKPTFKLLNVKTKDGKEVNIGSSDIGTVKADKKDAKKTNLQFKYGNNLFDSKTDTSKEKYFYQSDAANDSIITKLNDLKGQANKYIIHIENIEANKSIIEGMDKLTSHFTRLGELTHFEKHGTPEHKETKYVFYSFTNAITASYTNADVSVNLPSATGSLQKDELITKQTPAKYDETSTVQTAFLQGPNLFVIDNGEAQNKASVRFLNFVLKDKTPKNYGKHHEEDSNAAFIASTASYIVPYAGFGEGKELNFPRSKNAYLDLAFKLFTDKGITLYEEPTSKYSSTYREAFNSNMKSFAEALRTNGNEARKTFEIFAQQMQSTTTNFK